MNNQLTPPPVPPHNTEKVENKLSYGVKLLLLGLQCILLMIAALAIYFMTEDRHSRYDLVPDTIFDHWGRNTEINGPLIMRNLNDSVRVAPETFFCNANIQSQSLHRNIFETEVFNARVAIKASFSKKSLAQMGDTATIILELDPTTIPKVSSFTVCGKPHKWKSSHLSRYEEYYGEVLAAEIDLTDLPDVIEIATDFESRGAEEFTVQPLGEKGSIKIEGEASAPSFQGSLLPTRRQIDNNKFSAVWEYDNSFIDMTEGARYQSIVVSFLTDVDQYRLVTRALKYAFMIIVLTYLSVFITEIMMKRNVPLLNYFLIGAALVLFYCLLLAFTEHIAFRFAYVIAAVMTVALIAVYLWRTLSSKKAACVIGIILTSLYIACYIILNLSTYALLMGSLILFAALGATMYSSLKLRQGSPE